MWTDIEPMNCHREEAFCTILHAGELWQVLDEHLLPCLKVLQQLSVHRRVHGQLLDRRDQRLQLLDARHGPRIYLGTFDPVYTVGLLLGTGVNRGNTTEK